jgi:hypothetical protein
MHLGKRVAADEDDMPFGWGWTTEILTLRAKITVGEGIGAGARRLRQRWQHLGNLTAPARKPAWGLRFDAQNDPLGAVIDNSPTTDPFDILGPSGR